MSDIRIGNGFDVHRFVKNRELIIGGVKIDYELGLEGHSDADVLLHAIMDALLGAAGLSDIGQYFPPDDDNFKDSDSSELLQIVYDKIKDVGYKIVNIDSILIAQKPEMNPYISEMKGKISEILKISNSQINIKATTTEKLGFTGREEGIAAMAVCLIEKDG